MRCDGRLAGLLDGPLHLLVRRDAPQLLEGRIAHQRRLQQARQAHAGPVQQDGRAEVGDGPHARDGDDADAVDDVAADAGALAAALLGEEELEVEDGDADDGDGQDAVGVRLGERRDPREARRGDAGGEAGRAHGDPEAVHEDGARHERRERLDVGRTVLAVHLGLLLLQLRRDLVDLLLRRCGVVVDDLEAVVRLLDLGDRHLHAQRRALAVHGEEERREADRDAEEEEDGGPRQAGGDVRRDDGAHAEVEDGVEVGDEVREDARDAVPHGVDHLHERGLGGRGGGGVDGDLGRGGGGHEDLLRRGLLSGDHFGRQCCR